MKNDYTVKRCVPLKVRRNTEFVLKLRVYILKSNRLLEVGLFVMCLNVVIISRDCVCVHEKVGDVEKKPLTVPAVAPFSTHHCLTFDLCLLGPSITGRPELAHVYMHVNIQ